MRPAYCRICCGESMELSPFDNPKCPCFGGCLDSNSGYPEQQAKAQSLRSRRAVWPLGRSGGTRGCRDCARVRVALLGSASFPRRLQRPIVKVPRRVTCASSRNRAEVTNRHGHCPPSTTAISGQDLQPVARPSQTYPLTSPLRWEASIPFPNDSGSAATFSTSLVGKA
jgi:hypothetical protein